ncbi:MAG: efflux RND transporter permease subunit [Bdellovibrionales bacterium]|nr:efflux RND transporter permease subunit [Bdellovibrionales bacterium]
MISKLVQNSIRFRWLVILATAIVAIWGWQAFQSLPIDAVPDLTNVQVQVNTPVEALGPEEIERTITVPIETSLNGIPGVTQVRSITRFGLSQVTVVFEDDTDIYRARQLVSERLQTVASQLPEETFPELGPVTTGLGEIYHYVIEAEKPASGPERLEQLMELRALQDWHVKPRLLTVKGVAEVNSIGGFERQYHIQPDPKKMARYGIHFSDIEEAVEKVNRNVGGGYVEQTADQFIVQGSGLFKGVEDIRDVPVRTLENLSTITIGDIANVGLGKELRTGAAVHSGKEVVLGSVLMLMGENSRTVALRVAERIKEIQTGLPKGYKIEPVYDRSELVNATLSTVEHNLVLGAILVIVVLLLLVGNIRAALITAVVIPLSLLFTFIAMRRFGISGNLVSLGALDFGIIVDGAVIVLDNCVRHLHDKAQELKRSLTRDELDDTIHRATVEIRTSAGFGELIIVVVFLPIFAFVGIEGKMFVPMAATFIFAIVAAIILSFTFVPALASLILRGKVEDKEPKLMTWITRVYEPVLSKSLHRRKRVVGIAVGSVVLGVVLFSQLGGEFLPRLNEGSIATQFIRPVSVGLSHSIALEEKSQTIIAQEPEVKHVFTRIGTAEIATDPMGPNIADTYVMLKPMDEWPLVEGRRRTKEELIEAIVAKLDAMVPGQRVLVSQPIQLRFNELLEGTRADVSLKVFGEDQAVLTEQAQAIANIISTIPGAGDVEVEAKGTMSVLDVSPKKGLLRSLGVSGQEVLETVGVAIGGDEVGVLYEGMRRFPIVLRLDDEIRSDINALKSLPVGIAGNATVPLEELAEIRFKEAYSSFSREQTKRRVAVLINPRGRDTESFVEEAQQKIAEQVKLPPAYYVEWGGNFKNLQEARGRLLLLAPLALLLVLLMIYAAFRNVLETVLIFLCVPFALVGGVLALMARGLPFSISAGVGFIALCGIAVLNGVVLVNYFNQLRARGLTGERLVKQASALRLRPVLMTALVDVFGFIPMAISTGMGAEVQRPLAVVVIGGIISSTLLTLIVLPVLYFSLEKQIVRFAHQPKGETL